MDHIDLLSGAKHLLDRHAKKKPKQADLKRAISSTDCAMFHALARNCADMMIGGEGSDKSKHAWRQVYRAPDHGLAGPQGMNKKIIERFHDDIQDFADVFVALQRKRHDADDDLFYKTSKSEVMFDLAAASSATGRFLGSQAKDPPAFAALVPLKPRKQAWRQAAMRRGQTSVTHSRRPQPATIFRLARPKRQATFG